jgi:hypothetical protein
MTRNQQLMFGLNLLIPNGAVVTNGRLSLDDLAPSLLGIPDEYHP